MLDRIKRDIKILDFHPSVEFPLMNLTQTKGEKFDLFIMMEFSKGANRRYQREIIELITNNSELSKIINEIKIKCIDILGTTIIKYDPDTQEIVEEK